MPSPVSLGSSLQARELVLVALGRKKSVFKGYRVVVELSQGLESEACRRCSQEQRLESQGHWIRLDAAAPGRAGTRHAGPRPTAQTWAAAGQGLSLAAAAAAASEHFLSGPGCAACVSYTEWRAQGLPSCRGRGRG